jgi:hypothetical protein
MLYKSMIATACVLSTTVSAAAQGAMPYVPKLDPRLTSAQSTAIAQMAPRLACGPAKSVAVSAYAQEEESGGSDTVVDFPNTVTAEGGGWVNGNTFIAPCAGMYSLTISFNTDSYYPCPTHIGTQDDVELYFIRSTPPLYDNAALVGSQFGAWRGQLAGDLKRGQASYDLKLRLNAGDAIQTKVHSDGNPYRCLWSADISINREFN